jgi:hypothetical protein
MGLSPIYAGEIADGCAAEVSNGSKPKIAIAADLFRAT